MKNIIKKYSKLLVNIGVRTKNIIKHTLISFVFKGGGIIANFLLVPLTINYLDVENYGVWLIISSFISWFSFFDIGLGNGLRNKFAEAKALGNFKEAQGLVSTAYFAIGIISFCIIIIFFILNSFIDWTQVFNTKPSLNLELKILLPVIFAFFGIQLVVKLITTIYQADQHHSIQGKIQFYTQAISLFIIWILTKTSESSLLIFGTVFSGLPVLFLIGLNYVAFNNRYKKFKPKFSLCKIYYLKEITSLGFSFFIIQIAALILFSTDNFIITKLFSPEEVVPYNIAFKYFSIVTMAYTIIITPYWSSFTEAYANKDIKWIKKSVKNIQKIWLFIPAVLIFMIFVSDWFYELWVGDKVVIPFSLSILMALFVLLTSFNLIYVNFINGVGKIKLQIITAITSMLINIPLSIYFAKNLGLGTNGVILATCTCLIYSVVLRPMQYYKIINNKAKGIWNK